MSTSSERLLLPAPAPGTQRSLLVHRYGSPGARPKACFQASLHADEIPGLLVAQHLLAGLERAQAEGRVLGEVVVVPVANPIGLAQHLNGSLLGRFSWERGGNFNRGFPDLAPAAAEQLRGRLGEDPAANVAAVRAALAQAMGPAAPGETEALKQVLLGLALDADLVFDLHCAGEALPHLYASSWQAEAAGALGAELGAAAVLLDPADGNGGGTFDEACHGPWWRLRQLLGAEGPVPLASFAATVELRGQADVSDALAEADAAALLRFLQRRGVLAGDPGPVPAALCEPAPLEAVDALVAPAAGVVVYRKRLGEWVAEGEVVAEIVDPLGEPWGAARVAVRSRTAGLLFTHCPGRLVRPGQKFAKVAGRVRLQGRPKSAFLGD